MSICLSVSGHDQLFWMANPEEAEARRAYQKRVAGVRSGALPGLLENGSKTVRPEIKELIDAAIAKKRGDDAAKARWFDIKKLPKELAFDHNEVVKLCIRKLKRKRIYRLNVKSGQSKSERARK